MAMEDLSLCWDNFSTNISSGIYGLLAEGHLVDVTLAVGEQQIQVHRLVLSLCSPHFRQLFAQTPSNYREIVSFDGISFATLQNLIQYMYCGVVHVSLDDMSEFLSCAKSLQIKGLSDDNGPLPHECDDNESIIVQSTRTPIREQCKIKQSAPKRMKIRNSMETHSYARHESELLLDELQFSVPSNDHSPMSNMVELHDVNDEIHFEFGVAEPQNNTGAIDQTVDEAANWDQQQFVNYDNPIDEPTVAKGKNVGLIKCPHCDYTSKDNSNVKKHIRTQHTHKDDRPFKCAKCSYTAKEMSKLRRHEKSCKGIAQARQRTEQRTKSKRQHLTNASKHHTQMSINAELNDANYEIGYDFVADNAG